MINYVDNFRVLFAWRGSVVPISALYVLPSALLAVILGCLEDELPDLREHVGLEKNMVGSSTLWSAMTGVIGILIALRAKQALGRFWEGTSLLHQMRGEWFDAASCLITFSREAKLNRGLVEEVNEFRNSLIRLMSLMHGSALDEISGSFTDSYAVIDIGGLDTSTLKFLRDCQLKCNFSKVEALQHFIQVLITDNYHKGILSIPAPILSRVYQTLSRGFVNLLNARKIKDTMFPFPFVQTVKLLLLLHSFFTPVVMSEIAKSKAWAAVFTFIPLFGLHCLNFTAWQLEMPFGSDDNDLPLDTFQREMNDTLMMLCDDRADRVPSISKHATTDLTESRVSPGDYPKRPSAMSQMTTNSRSLERVSFYKSRTGTKDLNLEAKSDDKMQVLSNTKAFMNCDFLNRKDTSDTTDVISVSPSEESGGPRMSAAISIQNVWSMGKEPKYDAKAEESWSPMHFTSSNSRVRGSSDADYILDSVAEVNEAEASTNSCTLQRIERQISRLCKVFEETHVAQLDALQDRFAPRKHKPQTPAESPRHEDGDKHDALPRKTTKHKSPGRQAFDIPRLDPVQLRNSSNCSATV